MLLGLGNWFATEKQFPRLLWALARVRRRRQRTSLASQASPRLPPPGPVRRRRQRICSAASQASPGLPPRKSAAGSAFFQPHGPEDRFCFDSLPWDRCCLRFLTVGRFGLRFLTVGRFCLRFLTVGEILSSFFDRGLILSSISDRSRVKGLVLGLV